MFCYKCGQKLPDNSEFCYQCGAAQPKKDNESNSVSAPAASETNVPAQQPNAAPANNTAPAQQPNAAPANNTAPAQQSNSAPANNNAPAQQPNAAPANNIATTQQSNTAPANNNAPTQPYQQPYVNSMAAPVKKKSSKAPIIIAVIAVVVVAAIIAVVMFFVIPSFNKENESGNDEHNSASDTPEKDSDTTDDESSDDSDVEDTAEMLYNGTQISKLLEYSSNEIIKTFGNPVSKGDGYLIYDDISFFFASSSGKMEGIKTNAVNNISVSDVPNKDLNELANFDPSDTEDLLEEELGMKPQVHVYQKGAFKFEYNLPLYSVFLVCGEYSTALDSVWFLCNEPISDDEVRYNGISISTLLSLSHDDVIGVYGELPPLNPAADPSTYGGEGYSYEIMSYPYEDIAFNFNRSDDKITEISNLNKEWVTINGVNAGENPDELTKIFGSPTEKQDGSLSYLIYDYNLDFFVDDNGKVTSINVSTLNSRTPYSMEFLAGILGKGSEYLYNELGSPTGGTPVDGTLYFGGTEYYIYNGELSMLFNNDTPKTVYQVNVLPEMAEINGATLDKTRQELITLLGQPDSEDEYIDNTGEFSDYYYMNFKLTEYNVQIKIIMNDKYSTATSLEITRISDDRFLERHYSTGISAVLHDLPEYLTDDERERLINRIDETVKNVGFSVGIVITDDIGPDKSTEGAGDYSDQYFADIFGINADAIMYMYNRDTGDDYIVYYGRCEEIFTSDEVQGFFYTMDMYSNNPYDFLSKFCDEVEYYA